MTDSTYKNIYFRTRINEAGIRAVAAPVLEVARENSKHFDFQCRDLSDNKAFIDLTSMTVSFVIREKKYEYDPLIEKESGDGIDIVDAETGLITIELTADDMDIPVTDYFYDLVIEDEDERHSITTGIFRVLN